MTTAGEGPKSMKISKLRKLFWNSKFVFDLSKATELTKWETDRPSFASLLSKLPLFGMKGTKLFERERMRDRDYQQGK